MLVPAHHHPSPLFDRPGWIPPDIVTNWDPNPYAYQTEEELMPAGGPHGQLLSYSLELLRDPLERRGLMLLMDTFLLYRDADGVKQRLAPDLILMPFMAVAPSVYDLDVTPPPLFVAEVTSRKSHLKDLEQLVSFYLGLGVQTYLVIDSVTPQNQPRKQLQLPMWRCEQGQAVKQSPNPQGQLSLPELGVNLHAMGRRLILTDSVTGEVIRDNSQQRREIERLQWDKTKLQQTNAVLQQEKDQLRAELEAALEELARLKALSRH
jgi:Uma2 family endonuclease